MKKTIYFLFCLLLISCSLIENDSMKFKLEIENFDIRSMALKKVVEGEKIFIDSIYKKQWLQGEYLRLQDTGEYFLEIDNLSGIPLYMEKGFNLKIILNGANRFSYQGKGAEENEYLLRNLYHPLRIREDELYSCEPEMFLKKLKRYLEPFDELIKSNNDKSVFWIRAKSNQDFMKSYTMLKYLKQYQSKLSKPYKFSSRFELVLNKVDLPGMLSYNEKRPEFEEFTGLYVNHIVEKKNRNAAKLVLNNALVRGFEYLTKNFTGEIKNKLLYTYAMFVLSNYPEEESQKAMDYYFKLTKK